MLEHDKKLSEYIVRFGRLLRRFKKGSVGYFLSTKNQAEFRQAVIESVDFLNEAFGSGNTYSVDVIKVVNEGVGDLSGGPTYAAVQNVLAVLRAALAKLEQKQLNITATIESLPLTKEVPSAFISYSWDDEAHKKWVERLGARIRSDGIDLILDEWGTQLGDQLPHFMERAIRDSDFVVVICTPRYKQRSDARQGGVGYEGDIITAELFNLGNSRKFLPVLRSGQWSDAAPVWLSGCRYADLRGDPYAVEEYQKIICTLHKALGQPPPVGPPPSYSVPQKLDPAGVDQLEHKGQDHRDALPVSAVTTTPQLGEIRLVDRPVNLSPKEHEHHLEVVFAYRGSAPIRDWYTELEFPTRLLRRKHQYDSEVPERSNSSVSFFRWTNQPHGERIFPGDPKTMVRFIYAYEPTLITDPTPVLDARICARVFVDSRLAAEKMITVRELRAQAASRRDPRRARSGS